ncbi:MAG: tRNA guanosine(34) transglycosylase Tgt [Planctomycetes bacterium]|nr:tRNA guanosine(34) transglycosylase Tgt [Planctomycetota bacterium]
MSNPLHFSVIRQCGQARTGVLRLPHAVVPTPTFMAVGTRGAVKACTMEQVARTGTRICLGNTFHLWLRPGADVVEGAGGLHEFTRWPHAMLTDSGGFQVFSLADINSVDEHGVTFKSPYDGARIELTPERSIGVQNQLGADIIMAFDECPPYPAEREVVVEAVERTTRWARRCLDAHARSDTQALFGIVQGGVHADLRARSADALKELDFPGYAVGGLSVGETQAQMELALGETTPHLPEGKPRYLMGVGKPTDLVRGVLRGVDMFDCVLPTRNARTGEVYLWPTGRLRLKHAEFKHDHRPIDPLCDCEACTQGVKRSWLRHLLKTGEIPALTLCSLHNLRYYQRLMERIRREIDAGTFHAFARDYLETWGEAPPAESSA